MAEFIEKRTRGLCYVDLSQLDQGLEVLHHCLQLAPEHAHARVALAPGLPASGRSPVPQRTKKYRCRLWRADALRGLPAKPDLCRRPPCRMST